MACNAGVETWVAELGFTKERRAWLPVSTSEPARLRHDILNQGSELPVRPYNLARLPMVSSNSQPPDEMWRDEGS